MSKEMAVYKKDNVIIDAIIEKESIWLTQKQMSFLFGCTIENVIIHIKNIFKTNELEEKAVTKEYLATAAYGKLYKTKHYNLDAIVSVGYRVNSKRGTQFRVWAKKL
jgi:hypothetical protein